MRRIRMTSQLRYLRTVNAEAAELYRRACEALASRGLGTRAADNAYAAGDLATLRGIAEPQTQETK